MLYRHGHRDMIGETMEPDPLAVCLADRDLKMPRDLIERHHAELHRYALTMPRNRLMVLRAWLYRISLNVVYNSLHSRTCEATIGPSVTRLEAARLKAREAGA